MPTSKTRRVYRFASFRLDTGQRILEQDGSLLPVTPKVVDVLIVLVEHAGEVVDKETLFRLAWPDSVVVDSSLTKTICLLRKTLDSDFQAASLIETIPKRGYRFCGEVREDVTMAVVPNRSRSMAWAALTALAAGLFLLVGLYDRSQVATLTDSDREYLIARHLWTKAERSTAGNALARFQKAAELNPQSALAHAGVADAYTQMTTLAVGSRSSNLAQAREAADRAIALDRESASPHVSLGRILLLASFNLKAAESEYRKALTLDPKNVAALSAYACLLSHSGRFAEARQTIRRAQALDPVSPQIGVESARIEYYAGHYDQALAQLQQVLEREPGHSQAHYYAAMSLGQLGRVAEAREQLKQSRMHPSILETEEAWLASVAGDPKPAQQLLARRKDAMQAGSAKPERLLLPAIDAGEEEIALSALEQMSHKKSVELLSIRVNPRLAPLRQHARFKAVEQALWAPPAGAR